MYCFVFSRHWKVWIFIYLIKMLTENFAWLGKVRFYFLKMENQLKVNLYLPSWKRIKAAKITAKIPVCFIWNTETVMKQISNKKMISVFSSIERPYLLFLIRSTSGLLNVISQRYIRPILVRYFVSFLWLGIPSFNSPFYWLIKPPALSTF